MMGGYHKSGIDDSVSDDIFVTDIISNLQQWVIIRCLVSHSVNNYYSRGTF